MAETTAWRIRCQFITFITFLFMVDVIRQMAPLFSKVDSNKLCHDVQHEENAICAQFGKDLFNISKVIGRKKVAQYFLTHSVYTWTAVLKWLAAKRGIGSAPCIAHSLVTHWAKLTLCSDSDDTSFDSPSCVFHSKKVEPNVCCRDGGLALALAHCVAFCSVSFLNGSSFNRVAGLIESRPACT